MKKLNASDIQNLYEYEKTRNDFRRRIIELKKLRRISVGDKISFTFENRDTVRFQIQEMVRAERIVEERKIREEIDVYNEILPGPCELSATMFIEITEQDQIKPEIDRFQGVDRGNCVYFEFDGLARVFGQFEGGHSREDRISAVQYVRFPFTPEEQAWFRDPQVNAAVVIHHPRYQARTDLNWDQRTALAEDFEISPLRVA